MASPLTFGSVSNIAQDRRSPLGQYIRRATLSFHKIPFEGMSKVQLRLARWCEGSARAQDEGKRSSSQLKTHDYHRSLTTLIFVAELEVKPLDQMQETRTKAFEEYISINRCSFSSAH
jgi:hypothetical protein